MTSQSRAALYIRGTREAPIPECVEVEKLRRTLSVAWCGYHVKRIELLEDRWKKFYQGEWSHFELMAKRRVERVKRIGKTIGVGLTGNVWWLIQLSSTGWFAPLNGFSDPIQGNFIHSIAANNIRVRFLLSDDRYWNYHDPRTWGKWFLQEADQLAQVDILHGYGPDWFDETHKAQNTLLQAKTSRTVKAVLTDQRTTAGLGNYIACEVSHRAKVHPHRQWSSLTKGEKLAIALAIPPFLQQSMQRPDHQHWQVFLRKDQPCVNCSDFIGYVKDPGDARGSYYCPTCQPLGEQ